jgi:BMFP domain-containing protein YqiC
MIKDICDKLTQQIFDVLPDSVQQINKDIKGELKALISASFSRLDLVTREEFDIQTKVLQATRARVEALEKVLVDQANK